jgi:hypothetical protein
LLASGILKEQNCRTMFAEIFDELQRAAPTLYDVYTNMPKEEREKYGIINFPYLAN